MSSAVPASTGMAPPRGMMTYTTPINLNVVNLIVQDHNSVRAMYDVFCLPTTTLEQKQLLSWLMISALSEHAGKEEMVVYEAVRAALGEEVAANFRGEHAAMKLAMAQLDTMVASDPLFDTQVHAVLQPFLAHMNREETDLLPQLVATMTPESLLQLGIQFCAAKVRAPTRPHPEAPNMPPLMETTYAAAKQVDTALDQARMPSVVPILAAAPAGDTKAPPQSAPPINEPVISLG